ncbi:MAG TPA: glycosyltransferase [Solirubrobacteraceae bacterium]|nr:glycosyltransferase [Solirubrobacteraceae bacterium]
MASAPVVPPASIVVPTRARPAYLEVALASLAPQAAASGSELIVVDDAGASEAARGLVERFGARYEPHPRPLGLNVARNTGVERSRGELVVFVDDDVEVPEGWLAALLDAARAHPETEVFTGPIRVRLEGTPPHSCGREPPPITSLDLGPRDGWARFAWGSNMAIRRSALERVGPFDVSLEHGGDEQEFQERLGSPGAMYVAAAALDHRRMPADAHLRPLCRAAYVRGRAAWRFDAWRGRAPSLASELHTLAGCFGHVLRRHCPMGLTMVAHSWGRLRERMAMGRKLREKAQTPPVAHTTTPLSSTTNTTDDFLSGESGTVGGLDELRRTAIDIGEDALQIASARRLLLGRAARRSPPTQRVLALCVERPQNVKLTSALSAELARSRHQVELRRSPPGDAGKFENLNRMLATEYVEDFDWLFVLDDDIALPNGFVDRFLFLAERFSLDLAQPAHRAASHAAWRVTRRRRGAVARETRFVEIGPVTAFARGTYPELLPFPPLRMGWGLDLHWAALAAEHSWRCGVIDAVAIAHRSAPAASAYSREQALSEARAFLRERPYLRAADAQQTLVTHRRW